MVEHAPAARRIPRRTRQVIQGLLSLALVLVIFYKLFKGIDFGAVWTAVTAMTWLELTTLGLLAIWNLATYAFVWMSVTPGVGFGHAMVMTQSATAVANTVPGGSAIGIGMSYSMLGSWGYSRSKTTVAVLVSGVWNSFSSWAEVLAVFAFARLATAIPITPGGAGLVEAVLIGGLVAAGGAKPEVVAAVLVSRALAWLLPVPLGVGTYVWWRRRSWTAPSKEAPSPVSVPAS
jgi:uncharacterized membrane protein YbhN (UPF0104 family)